MLAYFHVLKFIQIHVSMNSYFYQTHEQVCLNQTQLWSLSLSLSYPEQSFYGMLCSWKVLACTGNSSEVKTNQFLLITPVLELTMCQAPKQIFCNNLIFKRQNRVPMTGVLIHFPRWSLCRLAEFLSFSLFICKLEMMMIVPNSWHYSEN